jgi:hypothetical protein
METEPPSIHPLPAHEMLPGVLPLAGAPAATSFAASLSRFSLDALVNIAAALGMRVRVHLDAA